VHIDTIGPRVLWDREWHGDTAPLDAQVFGLERAPDADVVVLQRPGRWHWTPIIQHLRDKGVRVVVDVDDAFDVIPRENVAWRMYQPRFSPLHNADWITRACKAADLVTVSTPALRDRYGGTVLPNLIPESYLSLGHATFGWPVIGWSGSVQTHPHDLEVTGGQVGRVVRQTGCGFRVVGTGSGVKDRLDLPAEPDSTRGWVPIALYPLEVARLDVGIVPLHPSPFNEAKSWLKLLEMSALGVPAVASPTGENLRLHKLGAGLLAHRPHDWFRLLLGLIRSEDRRAEVAGRSREAVAGLTYEARCGEWWDAWGTVIGGCT
jgi:hypothetical protein